MKENFFIVIEGIDNSGKSTLIQLLKEKLIKDQKIREYFGVKIVFTSEPYGPEDKEPKYEELSRPIFSTNYNLSPKASALLFLAIRAEHLKSFILPKAKENFLIICDRFYPSTLAYQVYLQGLDLNWIETNMNYLLEGIKPRVIFFLDVSWKNYSNFYLAKKNKQENNKYDSETEKHFQESIKAYSWVINKLKQEGQDVVAISDHYSIQEKVALIIETIQTLIS